MADAPSFRYIGKRRRAVEHRRFVVGQGRYAADVQPPGLLHVAIVASPHASARILSIDTSAPLAIPGVHAVVTGEEMQPEVAAMLPGLDDDRSLGRSAVHRDVWLVHADGPDDRRCRLRCTRGRLPGRVDYRGCAARHDRAAGAAPGRAVHGANAALLGEMAFGRCAMQPFAANVRSIL